MKRMIVIFLTSVLCVSLVMVPASASRNPRDEHTFNNGDSYRAERILYQHGVLKGTNTDGSGVQFATLDAPTRAQAAIMFVRLLGKEDEAINSTYSIPFADVGDIARPYIGYLYSHGLTNGVSSTHFGSTDSVTVEQYITFVLRALGYTTPDDFTVSSACAFANNLGWLRQEYIDTPFTFLRGDLAVISLDALSANTKGTDVPLCKSIGLDIIDEQSFWGMFSPLRKIPPEADVPSYLASYTGKLSADEMQQLMSDNLILFEQYSAKRLYELSADTGDLNILIYFNKGNTEILHARLQKGISVVLN